MHHLHLDNNCCAPCLCVTGPRLHTNAHWHKAHLVVVTVVMLAHYTADSCVCMYVFV